MADPRERAVAGGPFRPSAAGWNLLLDAAKAVGGGGAGPPGTGPTPRLLVQVRNDTGADLPEFSVLKLGASPLDVTKPYRLAAAPLFAGTMPATATDPFAVLIEPARVGQFALAVMGGVVPCEINVTDAGHQFAAPGATTARLTSASSGPARILDRETGTGNKKAVVQLEGGGGGSGLLRSAFQIIMSQSYGGADPTLRVFALSSLPAVSTVSILTVSTIWNVSGGTFVSGDSLGLRLALGEASGGSIPSPLVCETQRHLADNGGNITGVYNATFRNNFPNIFQRDLSTLSLEVSFITTGTGVTLNASHQISVLY